MSINKNIKKKDSLLYTYFTETDTGDKVLCGLVCLTFVFCLFTLPALLGFLADKLTPMDIKWTNSTGYEGYMMLGGLILFLLFAFGGIILILIEFSQNVASDIKLAKIKQLLPVTKEEWEAIGIKTKEDILDNLKCIFAENKRLDLYDNGDHELSPKIKDDVLDSVTAGYEFLWDSIKNTGCPLSKSEEPEIINERKSIYVTFKVLTTDDINRCMKKGYLEHIMFHLDPIFKKEVNCVIEAAEKEFEELQV